MWCGVVWYGTLFCVQISHKQSFTRPRIVKQSVRAAIDCDDGDDCGADENRPPPAAGTHRAGMGSVAASTKPINSFDRTKTVSKQVRSYTEHALCREFAELSLCRLARSHCMRRRTEIRRFLSFKAVSDAVSVLRCVVCVQTHAGDAQDNAIDVEYTHRRMQSAFLTLKAAAAPDSARRDAANYLTGNEVACATLAAGSTDRYVCG